MCDVTVRRLVSTAGKGLPHGTVTFVNDMLTIYIFVQQGRDLSVIGFPTVLLLGAVSRDSSWSCARSPQLGQPLTLHPLAPTQRSPEPIKSPKSRSQAGRRVLCYRPCSSSTDAAPDHLPKRVVIETSRSQCPP